MKKRTSEREEKGIEEDREKGGRNQGAEGIARGR